MEQLPYLERVKIQSEILLPLYKRLRAELGNERAAALLRAAVQEYGTALGASVAQTVTAPGLDKVRALMPMFSAGNALDVEPLVDNATEFSLNVRGCRYADYFRALGEPPVPGLVTV